MYSICVCDTIRLYLSIRKERFRINEFIPTDRQYNIQLIDEYQRLERILRTVSKENATETIRIVKEEMKYLRLKLQPIKLPLNEME